MKRKDCFVFGEIKKEYFIILNPAEVITVELLLYNSN